MTESKLESTFLRSEYGRTSSECIRVLSKRRRVVQKYMNSGNMTNPLVYLLLLASIGAASEPNKDVLGGINTGRQEFQKCFSACGEHNNDVICNRLCEKLLPKRRLMNCINECHHGSERCRKCLFTSDDPGKDWGKYFEVLRECASQREWSSWNACTTPCRCGYVFFLDFFRWYVHCMLRPVGYSGEQGTPTQMNGKVRECERKPGMEREPCSHPGNCHTGWYTHHRYANGRICRTETAPCRKLC